MLRIIVTGFLATFLCQAQLPVVRVAVLMDGPWDRNAEIRGAFEREINELLRGEFAVRFPIEKKYEAEWTLESVRCSAEELLNDPEVDFLLALGPLSANVVSRMGPLPKPVIAPFVIDPEVQGIPFKQGASGTRNLSYVVVGSDSVSELRMLREIVPFRKLTVLLSKGLGEGIPDLRDNMARKLRREGMQFEMSYVLVDDAASPALAAIPEGTEAVYVTPLLQLSASEFDRLIAGLIERKLPSFSMWGRSEVERGILAGLGLDFDYPRIARRTALNMQRILLGESAAELSVLFRRAERLTINMQTARAIQLYPSWSLMTEAELLSEQRAVVERQVSLASAVREATSVNLDLSAAERRVAAGLRLVRRARSNRGPQAGVFSSSTVIDGDRAEASFGSTGRFTAANSVFLEQLIYSEPVQAGIEVERHLQTTREQERNQLRLDVVQEAAISYLNVLRAKTVERIQKNNLGLTRRNLELARTRQSLGVAGPAEVYRWENQIANNRKDVIEASASRNQAEIAVNRVLNRPLEEPFATREASLDDPELMLTFQRLSAYVGNQGAFRIFREFMVGEAFEASPELKGLDAAVAAQDRTLLAARRSFYVPEIAARAEATGINRVGAGSAFNIGMLPGGLQFPRPGNVNWNVGFSVSLPLFTSGARRAEVERAREELARLNIERDAIRQRIEERTRSTLHAAGASFAGIQLASDAAAAANKNLELVTDSYSRGVVDILDLLDAQNASLTADLVAANAIYDFLTDLMRVERAVGRFDFFVSPSDEAAFFQRLDEHFAREGFPVRKK